ncbi:MAG: hypothetical protein Q9M40_05395 [Sulfurimonas sp.]|nr:hypothetical protein [Sulfurimonas sp.]
MLQALEFASNLETTITIEVLKSLRPNALQAGSSEAGVHYDLISALIKSVRGSDEYQLFIILARLDRGWRECGLSARRLVILCK